MKKTLRQPLINRIVRYAQAIVLGITLGYCALTICSFLDSWTRLTHLLVMLLLLPVMFAFEHLLTLVHEAGHLIGGLLSGRKMYYINIAGHRLVRRPDGSFRRGYAAAPGMGGSCMTVAEDDKPPYFLYFLLGPLSTLLLGGLCAAIAVMSYPAWDLDWDTALRLAILHIPMTMLAMQGVLGCIVNLIPQRYPGGLSDGLQLITLARDSQSRADWQQVGRIAWHEYQGLTPPQMPEELFAPLPMSRLTNPYAVSLTLHRLGRLMDQRDFTAALSLCGEIMDAGVSMGPLQQLGVIRSGAVCEAMTDAPDLFCQRLHDADMQRLIKYTGRTTATQLAQYALAKLVQRDEELAARHLTDFTRSAARSPFRQRVRLDMAMILLINEKAKEAAP